MILLSGKRESIENYYFGFAYATIALILKIALSRKRR
jgi:hypothetical protein